MTSRVIDYRTEKLLRTEGEALSTIALRWAREQRIKLGTGPRLLLMLICDSFNDEQERAWPKQITLAEEVDKDERTVRRWQKELEKRGLIEVHHVGPTGKTEFTIPAVEELLRERRREAYKSAHG
jgi:hypothetical protein